MSLPRETETRSKLKLGQVRGYLSAYDVPAQDRCWAGGEEHGLDPCPFMNDYTEMENISGSCLLALGKAWVSVP